MTLWQNLDMSERIAAAQTTASNKNIEDRAVEKDWWVAAGGNNTQLKNLRKASRKYIHGTLSKELGERLSAMGIVGFTVENQTTQPTAEGPKPIDADSDPTVILVNYDSVFPAYDGDILPRVKIGKISPDSSNSKY